MAFPNNCNPRIIDVSDSCGCTLTRASVTAMTKSTFEAQDMLEVGMDKIIAQQREARMTGVKESTLMDLLLSRHVPLKTVSIPMLGQSVISPFFYRPQRHNINPNYFLVTAGVATPGAGTGSIPASAWDLTVQMTASPWATNLPHLEKFFSPGHYITVLYKDAAAGNVGRTLQYKVIKSVNADAGGVNKATITVEPNYSPAGWTALSGANKLIYQTTHGVLIPMANSVSDYESWCNNRPAVQNNKLLTYWWQTIRETHCYNDEYIKAIQATHLSHYAKEFKLMPLAQQRKQQAYLAELAYYNTIFYGQRITELQTDETYKQLPTVVDPADTSCVLEYKANTEGIRTQLANCARVIDMQGAALNMNTVKDLLYTLRRNRSVDSGSVDTIDVFTDRFTRSNLMVVMIDYYKKKYQMPTERFYQPNQTLKFENITGLMSHDIYEFPEEGVRMAVFSHEYFDDHLSAFGANAAPDKSRGRKLWMIDWSDVEIGVARARSVQRKTNEADNLYNCVIQPNVNHYQLMSKVIAVMIADPNRHMILENFSEACPILSAAGCTATS